MIKLSVLDQLPPGPLPQLVTELDALGYHRFWATEHHSSIQSASPTLVTCLAACLSGRIRVGTAAILLNYVAPIRVAEDFRLLELYFPGRLDLGVAGAAATHERFCLDGRPRPDPQSFAARLAELVSLVRGEHEVAVGPAVTTRPTLWLCGTTTTTAALAGRLGMYFACHAPIAKSRNSAYEVIRHYRDSYRGADVPYAAISVMGSCAKTESLAQEWWPSSATPGIIGTPQMCAEQLQTLAEDCRADEAIVNLYNYDIEARITGYRLLAEAMDLPREQLDDT